MSDINFAIYPTSNRTPGVFAEVDNSKANTGTINQRALIIGQMTPAGTAQPNVPFLLAGQGAVGASAGANSVSALMANQYRLSDTFGEVWVLPVADAGFTLKTSAAQGAPGVTLQFAPGAFLNALTTGLAVTGPDIPAATTVASVDPTTGVVTLSQATTAAVPQSSSIVFGAAVAASQEVTISGAPTALGILSLYVAGIKIAVAVQTTDTPTTIAANIAAAINASPLMPVTATASAGVVTVTAVNAGETGNDIDLRLNYLGERGSEVTPPGIAVTFSGTLSGSGYLCTGGQNNPSLTAALANLPAQPFDFIACAFTDATSLASLDTFLNDSTGRWSWQQELFGGYFGAYRGTLGACSTFGTSNNNQHGSIMAIYDVPQPSWIWAAEITAQCAVSLRANPAMPLQNIDMNVMGPPEPSQWDIGERNTLLYDGLSTFKVEQAGQVVMERMTTTYQTNAQGQPDNSYLDVETMYTLMAVIRDYRTFLTSNFARQILVADGSNTPYGSNMVTSQTIRAAVNARYATQAANGWVQNPSVFAQQSQAQNAGGGLVKLLLPIQIANQLRQIAMLVQFTKP